MELEFTGERVVPGQVDDNLWNEHFARYVFAARLCRGRRVLDIGCGTGYGAAELTRTAAAVTAIDLSPEAVRWAREHTSAPVRFVASAGERLPFREAQFDLVTSFEVIEHIPDWPGLIAEARRVLAPGGQFVVSTPNRLYYAEARHLSGPNPYHEHEFEFEEFREALAREFGHVAMFVQNHGEGVIIEPIGARGAAEARFEEQASRPETANFFIAVCATTPLTGAPSFIYIPRSGNILHERESHIRKLERELETKDEWLNHLKAEHSDLVERFRLQKEELEQRNAWAASLDTQLAEAGARILALQDELAEEQRKAAEEIARLEAWGTKNDESEREARRELQKAVDHLHAAEALVEERTAWALRLSDQITRMETAIGSSRTLRLARRFGLLPPPGQA